MEADRVYDGHRIKLKYTEIADVSATNEVGFEKVDKASDLKTWLFCKKKYCDISLLKLSSGLSTYNLHKSILAVGVSLQR